MVGSPVVAFFAEDENRLTDGWGYLVRAMGLLGRAYRIGPGYDSRMIEVAGVSELPDLPLVVVTPEGARHLPGEQSLIGFAHPAECVYLFGSSNSTLDAAALQGRTPVARIFIPSVDGTELFAHVAGAMVLWDREMKGG